MLQGKRQGFGVAGTGHREDLNEARGVYPV